MDGTTWEYTSNVIAALLCPRRSWTTFGMLAHAEQPRCVRVTGIV